MGSHGRCRKNMGAQILGQLIGLLLGALVMALVLQLVTKWVCKFDPPYWMAYKVLILTSLASFGIGILFSLVTGVSGEEMSDVLALLLFLIGFVVASGLFGIMIKHPESGRIGPWKGFLITLVLMILGVAFFGLTFLLLRKLT